jgi:hypothetical protein
LVATTKLLTTYAFYNNAQQNKKIVKTEWLKTRKINIMGCGESKIKSINLAQDNAGNNEDHIEMTKKQSLQILKGENYNFQNSNESENSKKNSDEALPNRLLSAIPISDLGESLDSRHLSESFNGNSKFGKGRDFLPQFHLIL